MTGVSDPQERIAIGRSLEQEQLERRAAGLGRLMRPGHILLMHGSMAAGKTTFVRALSSGLGVDRPSRVRSPTFNICLLHSGPIPLWHVDLFRLEGTPQGGPSPAFEALGLQALIERIADGSGTEVDARAGVIAIEWAELWGDAPGLPGLRIALERPAGQEAQRDIWASASGDGHAKLLEAWRAQFVDPSDPAVKRP